MTHVIPVVPLTMFGDEPEPVGDTFNSTYVDVHVPDTITVQVAPPAQEHYVDSSRIAPQYVADWDSYIGQQHIKDELSVYIDESFALCKPLPHILLAASMPGAGKTTLARLIAQEVEQKILMLVPPFKPEALYEAAMSLSDFEILFIDEIHKLADHGPKVAENLYHLLEEKVLYLNGTVVPIADITVVGATTDEDKLPEPLLDRFPVRPYFQPYSLSELVQITHNFCRYFDVVLPPETMVTIAKACRGTPRIARSLVEGAKALQISRGRPVTGTEVLNFKQVDPDGMTRLHKSYVLALFRNCQQVDRGEIVYRAGVDTIQKLLRQNSQGIARLERFLLEQGFIVQTGRGRMLTGRGIDAAFRYIENGER